MAKKRKAKKAKTGTKYAVDAMLTLDNRAPIKSIKESVRNMLEKLVFDADGRSSSSKRIRVVKATIRSVDED